MKLRSSHLFFLIFLVSLLFFTWGNPLLPVTDPVESNYAETAREMVSSGNWISPQIYGIYWYDKPIMVYWLMALSYTLFGITDFAARFPAALSGAAGAAALAWYVLRLTRSRTVALWAAVMLSTMVEYWVISHAVITDSILFFFTIPTMLSAYIGLTEGSKKHMMIAYGAAALACLTKGPVGLVLPGLLLLLWCASMKSWLLVRRCFPWEGILVFLVLSLPWYGTMYALHGSDFVNQFLGLHNVVRATSSEHPDQNHWYYYLVLLPVSLLPWTGLSFMEMWRGRKEKDRLWKFLMIWCWGTLLFYTIMATKYVTYTYILLAPAAFLAAMAVPRLLSPEGKTERWALAGPFLFTMILWGAATFFVPAGNWMVLYIVVAYAIIMTLFRWRRGEYSRLLRLAAMASVAAVVCIISEGIPYFMHSRSAVDGAAYFQNLDGEKYFFKNYQTSYTYYTGDVATRLQMSLPQASSAPSLPSSGEKRSDLWNEKYVMPSSDLAGLYEKSANRDVYLYVDKSDLKPFNRWPARTAFAAEREMNQCVIYKLVDRNELL